MVQEDGTWHVWEGEPSSRNYARGVFQALHNHGYREALKERRVSNVCCGFDYIK